MSGILDTAQYHQQWSYDDVGRRVEQATITDTDEVTATYGYGGVDLPRNAVTSVETTGGNVPDAALAYHYDEAGNTITRPDPDGGQQQLTWNAEGKLTQLVTDETSTTYVYDPDGNLLIETDEDHSTLLLGDTELRWDKDTEELSAQRHYDTPVNATVTRSTDTELDVLITDHHNTASLSLEGLTVAATHRWTTPFGEPRGTAPAAWPNAHGFLNKHENPDTGLTAVGARHYDPTIGKFISADPVLDLESPLQLLGYNYANDNPLTFSDPSGLHPIAQMALSLANLAKNVVRSVNSSQNRSATSSPTQSYTQTYSTTPVQSVLDRVILLPGPHPYNLTTPEQRHCARTTLNCYGTSSDDDSTEADSSSSTANVLMSIIDESRKMVVGDSWQDGLITVATLPFTPLRVGGNVVKSSPKVVKKAFSWGKRLFTKKKPKPPPRAAANTGSKIPFGPGSEKAWTVLNRVDAKGAPLPGYKGGRVFENTQGRLPETPGVTYREWDVNPYVKGVNRGPERIVTGSDGSAYWPGDHYDTFLMFRGPTQ